MGFGGSSGSSSISGADDAVINTPTDGQALVYNTSKWRNAAGVDDSTVVHKDGAETIVGAKAFTMSPTVPSPVDPNDAAHKNYVDGAVAAASFTASEVTSTKKTTSFTLSMAELGKVVECESGSPMTVTIPTQVSVGWPDDAMIELSQTGTGVVTVQGASGVTLQAPADPAGLRSRSQWSGISLRRRAGVGTNLTMTGRLAHFNGDDIPSSTDGQALASWADSAGNVDAATQASGSNQPTLKLAALNGHKGVRFNGTSQWFNLTGTALALAQNRGTMLVSVVYTALTSSGQRSLFSLAAGNNGNADATRTRALLQWRESGGHKLASARRLDAQASSTFTTSAATVSAPESGVLTGIYDWASGTVSFYSNGTLQGSANLPNSGLTDNTPSLAGAIGTNPTGASAWLDGYIMEIFVYSAIDAGTRASIHTYVQNKYGITVSDYAGVPDEWVVTGDTMI